MTLAQTLAVKWKEWPNNSVKFVADGTQTCTRAEWQAAVDALNAPKVVEWPEGATHKFSEPTTSPWRDLSGETWKWLEGGEWRDSGASSKSLLRRRSDRLTAKVDDLDSAWLPSAGSVIQYSIGDGWYSCEVRYVLTRPDQPGISLVAWCPHLEKDQYLSHDRDHKFRPIRTAEQVADEEREKAVAELVELFVNHYEYPKGAEQFLLISRKIHDAGYRKEPKPCGS